MTGTTSPKASPKGDIPKLPEPAKVEWVPDDVVPGAILTAYYTEAQVRACILADRAEQEAEHEADKETLRSIAWNVIDEKNRLLDRESAGAEHEAMRLKLIELAGCCAECSGTSEAFAGYETADLDSPPMYRPCPDCADIRAAIPTPPTVTVEAQK